MTVSQSTFSTSKITSTTSTHSQSTSSTPTKSTSSTRSASTSISIQLGTPTGCSYPSINGNLIWQNATSEISAFGLYGTTDTDGFPATANQLGVWSGSDLSSWPDILFDIRDPAFIQAIYSQNGSNVVIDTTNNRLIVSNCSTEANLPLPPITKRQIRQPKQIQDLEYQKRQSYNSPTFSVTLTYTTQCGEPDQWQDPQIYCIDDTLSLGFGPAPRQPNVIQTSPGVYTASCSFVEPSRLMANSLECTNIYPGLVKLCEISDAISPEGVIAGTLCFALLAYGAATGEDVSELYPQCVEVVSQLADLCGWLNVINGGSSGSGLETFFCGPIPSVTSTRVAVGGKSWFSPMQDLGTRYSNAPHDISYTNVNQVPVGSKCSACSSGTQVLYTPWEEVYRGSLFMRNDWSCNLDYYGAISGIADFGSAQMFCQAFAEENSTCQPIYIYQLLTIYANIDDAIWIADLETVVDSTGTPISTPVGGCWAGSCSLSSSDFTLDFNSMNLNPSVSIDEQVIAYT